MKLQNSEVRMPGARSVLLILLLSAGSLSPPVLRAQEARGQIPVQSGQGFHIEQNYPHPINPDTYIPFVLEESLFERSDSVVVTLRIVNILNQVVAIPDLQVTERTRERLLNLVFRRPARMLAYWDGRDLAGERVPGNIYYAVLDVQGQVRVKKLVVENPTRRRSIIPRF
jgi:hypothetical protein